MSHPPSDDRLIPVPETSAIAGLCRSKIYLLVNRGEFPKPIKIGSSTRFSAREVHAWVEARKAERDGG